MHRRNKIGKTLKYPESEELRRMLVHYLKFNETEPLLQEYDHDQKETELFYESEQTFVNQDRYDKPSGKSL